MSNGVTPNGAETKLRSFFRGVEGDYASVETIFRNEKRDPNSQKDKNWFYNYNTILKKFGLAHPLKGVKNGVSVTIGLTLTDKGRKVLEGTSVSSEERKTAPLKGEEKSEVTLATWRSDAYKLREKHPELVIEFDVRMRRDNE